MSSTANTAPILVVGNGPAGLIAALTLLRNGVPVRIIDKRDKYHAGQRGCGVQPRSLELYNLLGVPEIAKEGQPLMPMRNYGPIGSTTVVSEALMIPHEEDTPAKPYANGVLLGQHHSEEIIRAHVEKCGVFVELNTELVSIERDSEGVIAQIVKNEDGKKVEETVRTPFLIGADGGKGVSRKLLGLELSGISRPSDRALVGDMYVKGLDFNYWHRWGDMATKFITFRPTEFQDLWAVVLGARDANYETLLTDREVLKQFIEETTGRNDLILGEIKELNEFSPNIRMVNEFGKGRCFLVGDSAHVHSPTGGQGMNSSVQDSLNLCWKLSLVYKGLAPPSLLSSYTTERVPVIQEMLQQSTKLLNRIMTTKAKDHNTPAFVSRRPKSLDQLGVNYRWSNIVVDENRPYTEQSQGGALSAYGSDGDTTLRAGDRAPEAPGLAIINAKVTESDSTTSLFSIFGPSLHTALIFASDVATAKPILDVLAKWPKGTIQNVVVLPKDVDQATLTSDNVDAIVVTDRKGHAYDAYGSIVSNGFPVVIVRPDGVIGAIVKAVDGIVKYEKGIF